MRFSSPAFTLIELMITLSIFFILSMSTYISYSHFHKKSLLNQGVKEITKSIYDARNLAINGIDSGSGNLSIGLYFDSSTPESQKKIQYFSYPHTFSGSQVVPEDIWGIEILKELDLSRWVTVSSVWGYSQFLIFFSTPNGVGEYYYWDTTSVKQSFTGAVLPIQVSYMNATSPSLQREINYYTGWNIADY